MGRDKRDLPFGGATFFDRVLGAATAVFDAVIVVGPVPPGYQGEFIVDPPGRTNAPILGIRTALQHTRAPRIWILATDYPLMTSEALAWLRDRFLKTEKTLCVPRIEGRAHMLCAGYDRSLLPAIEAKVEEGDLQLRRLIEERDSLVIEESEFPSAGRLSPFINVNTPSEYQRALEIYERESRS